MKYIDPKSLKLKEKSGFDVYELIGANDMLEECRNSIMEDIFELFENGEELPAMAIKLVLKHIEYFREIDREIEIVQALMNAEKEERLVKLNSFDSNPKILMKHYAGAIEHYIASGNDVWDWILDDSSLRKKFDFLLNFGFVKKIDSYEEENLYGIIASWRVKVGNKIMETILKNEEFQKMPHGELFEILNVVLGYNPACTNALRLKLEYLETQKINLKKFTSRNYDPFNLFWLEM